MTTQEFIIKHVPDKKPLAAMLNMTMVSFRQKLTGTGKASAFKPAELDRLYAFVQSIGNDAAAVKKAVLDKLYQEVTAKGGEPRRHHLSELIADAKSTGLVVVETNE